MDETIESLKAALAVAEKEREKAEAERDEARAANDGITKAADKLAARIVELEAINNMELTETGVLALLAAAQKRIEALGEALHKIDKQCAEGFVVCSECGHDESMEDLDIRLTVKDALNPALASPSESAPQPTPETRVDFKTFFEMKEFLKRTAGDWAAPHSTLCFCGDEGGECPAPAIRAEAKALLPKAEEAVERARRAAPTGQQQEAGPVRHWAGRNHFRPACGADRPNEGTTSIFPNVTCAECRLLAAASPSAPQEGLAALERAKERLLGSIAHGSGPDDYWHDLLRCHVKEVERDLVLVAKAHMSAGTPNHARKTQESTALLREVIYEADRQRSQGMSGAYLSPSLVDAIRALPLPEGALTKAAPLTQPAVPEERCDWWGHDGEGPQCMERTHLYLSGRPLCVEHAKTVVRLPPMPEKQSRPAAPAPVETPWTCPDCCVRPCTCMKDDAAPVETRLTGLTEEDGDGA